MNRRDFLRTVAVSAGLLATGKVIVSAHEQRADDLPIVLKRHMELDRLFLMANGKSRRMTKGRIEFLRGEKDCITDRVRVALVCDHVVAPQSGFKRVSVSIENPLYEPVIQWQVIDEEM